MDEMEGTRQMDLASLENLFKSFTVKSTIGEHREQLESTVHKALLSERCPGKGAVLRHSGSDHEAVSRNLMKSSRRHYH